MPAENHFRSTLAGAWPLESWRDVTVLLAVSGGADSVALLRAVNALKQQDNSHHLSSPPGGEGQIYVAHFNHGLRGQESDADQAFVIDLCARLGVACESGQRDVTTMAEQQGDGIEAAAREARYDFFRETARRVGARYVVTAHTADDQAETILHRIVRGTGLSGLAGIARSRQLCDGISLMRPLLQLRRVDVLAYLKELQQTYQEDASNRDLRFTRNRIRQQLLPQLEADYNPNSTDALLRLGRLATEAQQVIESRIDEVWESAVVEQTASTVRLDNRVLCGESDYLVRELLMSLWRRQNWPQQQMGLPQWEALAAMTQEEGPASGALSLPGGVRAKKEGEQLSLTRPR